MAGQRKVTGYVHTAGWEKYEAKNTLSSKTVIQSRRRDSFPNKQKVKEFVTNKPVLHEILKGTHWGWKKDKKQIKTKNEQRAYPETPSLKVTQLH